MNSLKKNCLSFKHTISQIFKKGKDPFNVQSLFDCYFVLMSLFIIEQLIRFFKYPDTKYRGLIIFIPIGVLLFLQFTLYYLKRKSIQLQFEKERHKRYLFYFDLTKLVIYLIFAVVQLESKIFEAKYRESQILQTGFWISFEYILISLPAIVLLQTSLIKLAIILFQIIYSFLRLSSWDEETLGASFIIAKVILLTICFYQFFFSGHKITFVKKENSSEKRFSSKILDILPEGVAIIDENGLKYQNDSFKTILGAKESERLNILENLENKDFAKDSSKDSFKRIFSFDPRDIKRNSATSPRANTMGPVLNSPLLSGRKKSSFLPDEKFSKYLNLPKNEHFMNQKKLFDSQKRQSHISHPGELESKSLNTENTPLNPNDNITLTILTEQNNSVSPLRVRKNLEIEQPSPTLKKREKSVSFNNSPQIRQNEEPG